MRKNTKDSIVIGFALFSMFFGAGNLIFPAFLGHTLGKDFFLGIIGFIITGVGLPLLAILACSKGDGTFETLAGKIDKKFAVLCTAILFIAIGPMLGIPRTAATTYELTIHPFFPNISPLVAMTIYFLINLFFVLRSSSVIDAIGKYLTPALLIILTIIIIKGIFMPIGKIVNTNATSVLPSALLQGYQTMDAIAALLFAGIITTSLISKGYKEKQMPSMILKSSLVAVIGLAFVYGGLMYIGAQTVNLAPSDIGKTGLLLLISKSVLGNIGTTLIGVAMGLACLTTSIGLLTAGATFFEKVSKGKLSFKLNAIVLAIISLGIACLGVDKIVVLSEPILNVLYPVSITLIVTTLLSKYITNIKAVKLGVYTSLIFGLLFAIPGLNLSFIPLANIGFGWVLPTLLAICLGYIIFSTQPQINANEI
ncbi:MAG: branched-chain amino acid transport system II carrier protein [Clostridium septicum]|uniref:branched-chain amino acid transport system II carrier protein n=1 Tax=Clostridium septicum TaxID=1504 RepID=UPI002589109B|nr:branched-chain amino acid transport system II carrier protein [Clostridium septicum]MDU1314700.1 branched-chain amino acid transport system II carrier protein [Clostridium septicum]